MSTVNNKKLIQAIFSELEKSNDQPFLDAMADDMQWNWMGSGRWGKSFIGKEAVLAELWSAVRATLVPPYKITARRFIAEEEYVAVEAQGHNVTPEGKTYNNRYCWVCRIVDGKIRELNEYMDTELVTSTFRD